MLKLWERRLSLTFPPPRGLRFYVRTALILLGIKNILMYEPET